MLHAQLRRKQRFIKAPTPYFCFISEHMFSHSLQPNPSIHCGTWAHNHALNITCYAPYTFEYGELSNSQKQAVRTLVEKRGKDKRQIKNWRPISLINVDAKIASKALAKRLENVLPEIVHFDQSAFVKGRTIFDAIRTIDDVIEHTMNRDISGILVAVDFEKAFDSLNFSFLLRVLHAFKKLWSFFHSVGTSLV